MLVLVPCPLVLISSCACCHWTTSGTSLETQHQGISDSLMTQLQKWIFLAEETKTGVVSEEKKIPWQPLYVAIFKMACSVSNSLPTLLACFGFRNTLFDRESRLGARSPSFRCPPLQGKGNFLDHSTQVWLCLSELAAACPPVPPAHTAPPGWSAGTGCSAGLWVVPSLLCSCCTAQFKPEANATHDTQLSVAWNGVLPLQRQPRALWLSSQTDPALC